MNALYTLMICFLFWSFATAQDLFYYGKGQKIPLSLSDKTLTIKFKTDVSESQMNDLKSSDPDIDKIEKMASRGLHKVSLKNDADIQGIISRLQINPKVERINPAYKLGEMEMLISDLFRVQFKSGITRAEIDALNEEFGVEIVEELTARPGVFTLRVKSSIASVLDITNRYYEDPNTEWAVPKFFHRWSLHSIPNDTYFASQYYLHNTGQTGGVADADINAPEAWDITLGSPSIVVAVIDQGVSTGNDPLKPAHEDLPQSRIVRLDRSDFYNNDENPDPEGNQAHGFAVAGIIAASHNNGTGIAGIAPNCKIMPIRMFGARIYDDIYEPLDASAFADAIDFARERNADVISNSWGNDVDGYWNDDIASAISRALTQGRNGKGCVVVQSAGNNASRSDGYYGFVEFPANVNGVIAVGATDKSNNILYYSPRSKLSQKDSIDVVCPTGQLPSLVLLYNCDNKFIAWSGMEGDVWSLDIPGNAGYNNGLYRISSPYCYDKYTSLPPGYEGDGSPYNYMRRFGGTSAACPQVSGVAALILSLNSNFTQSQVQYFIRNSAVDMGTAGWDVDFGFGRLNAHKALVLAGFPIIADPITNIHWCYNSQKKISWTSNLSTSYTVKVSTDGGSTFPTTIASNVTSGSASYSYNWTVNIGPSFTCKLLVIDNNNSALRDTSDLFVIDGTAVPSIPGSFSLTSKGGHPWLTWTTDGSAAGYDLYRASSEYNPPYTWYKFMTINDPTITNYHDVVVDIGITNPNTMKYKINAFNGCNMYSVFTAEKQINYDQFMKNNNANETLIPNEFSLNQNYPNPFNPTTTIEYAVAKTTLVRLTVYDELGREVAILVNEKKMPGIYRVDFDASKFASGVYFYRMTAGEFMETKKLLLVK